MLQLPPDSHCATASQSLPARDRRRIGRGGGAGCRRRLRHGSRARRSGRGPLALQSHDRGPRLVQPGLHRGLPALQARHLLLGAGLETLRGGERGLGCRLRPVRARHGRLRGGLRLGGPLLRAGDDPEDGGTMVPRRVQQGGPLEQLGRAARGDAGSSSSGDVEPAM